MVMIRTTVMAMVTVLAQHLVVDLVILSNLRAITNLIPLNPPKPDSQILRKS